MNIKLRLALAMVMIFSHGLLAMSDGGSAGAWEAEQAKTKEESKPVEEVAKVVRPELTRETALTAAMLAVARKGLPGAKFEERSWTLSWTLQGAFKRDDGGRLDRLVVFLQAEDGRTFSVVDIVSQEWDMIRLKAYEIETPEGGESDMKVKVSERDSASTNYMLFDLSEVEALAKKAIADLSKDEVKAGNWKGFAE